MTSLGFIPRGAEVLFASVTNQERMAAVGLTHEVVKGVHRSQVDDAVYECLMAYLPAWRTQPFMAEAQAIADRIGPVADLEGRLLVEAHAAAWPEDADVVLVERTNEQVQHDKMLAAALRILARGSVTDDAVLRAYFAPVHPGAWSD